MTIGDTVLILDGPREVIRKQGRVGTVLVEVEGHRCMEYGAWVINRNDLVTVEV